MRRDTAVDPCHGDDCASGHGVIGSRARCHQGIVHRRRSSASESSSSLARSRGCNSGPCKISALSRIIPRRDRYVTHGDVTHPSRRCVTSIGRRVPARSCLTALVLTSLMSSYLTALVRGSWRFGYRSRRVRTRRSRDRCGRD